MRRILALAGSILTVLMVVSLTARENEPEVATAPQITPGSVVPTAYSSQ